jgi:hypothetical protein
MRKSAAALLVALVAILAVAAMAQQQQLPQQAQQAQQLMWPEVRRTFAMAGTFELGGAASFASYTMVSPGVTSDATYSIGLSPTVGYFVADELELVLDPLTLVYAWSGDISTLSLMPMAGVAYNFRAAPRAFPYLEGVAGYAYERSTGGGTTLTRNGLAWAARGGVKFLVTGTAIVNMGLQYEQVTLNRSGDSERNGYNTIALTAGISFWL